MKETSEKQEINKLKKIWSTRVDFDAKEFLHVEVALLRVKMLLNKNPHWTDLKDKALQIATRVDTHR